jgi:outer membrane cobalamin receptor
MSRDSLRTAVADTSRVTDTLRIRFIPAIGSLRGRIDSSNALHSSRTIWTDARFFGDLAWRLPGFFVRDLGEPGKPGQINAWGVDWRGIAVLMDGRPMNDPVTGTVNLYDIPMEFVEQIEDFSGVHSSAEAWNAPGATVNLVTPQYNTLHPITRIRYVQAPNNNLFTDGLFTQNLLRGLNLMFGFTRLVSDGRFNGARENSYYTPPQGAIVDNWNVRTRLRYNFSDQFNIALTDFYTKDINGLNGGIDLSRTANIFDNVTAFVNDPNASETVSRRDVSLLAAGKFFGDSTAITQLSLYYTSYQRDFVNNGSEFTTLSIANSHHAQMRGVRLQQSLQSGFHNTQVGLQWERSQYSSDGFYDTTMQSNGLNAAKRERAALFLITSLCPSDFVSPSFSLRSDHESGGTSTSYGIELKLTPLAGIEVLGGYGQSFRFPTFQESSWSDSTLQRPLKIGTEKHNLYRAGLQLSLGENGTVSLMGFDRTVHDAITFQPTQTASGTAAVRILNITQVHTQGLTASMNMHFGPFSLDGTILYSRYKEVETIKVLSPDLLISGELSYRNKFFKDALDAKLGIRSHFMNRQRGMTFNPQMVLYTENTVTDLGRWTRLDVFAVVKLGTAYLTLSYENILNASYLITPVYPMPERTLRFGVNWEFLD